MDSAKDCEFISQTMLGMLDALGRTRIHLAAQNGDEAKLSSLLALGTDINVQDAMGITPFVLALENDNPKMANILADNGSDVSGSLGIIAANAAASHCRASTLRWLWQEGIPLIDSDTYGRSALHCAAMSGSAESVKLLLSYGAKIDSLAVGMTAFSTDSAVGHPPLDLALYFTHGDVERRLQVIDLLLDEGSDLPVASLVVVIAVRSNFPGALARLLDRGADINTEVRGFTPLRWAIRLGYRNIAETLAENGALF